MKHSSQQYNEQFIDAPDLNQLLDASLQGKWVAIAPDYSAVWASAESVRELMAALSEEERAAHPVFYKVPAADSYYIPAAL